MAALWLTIHMPDLSAPPRPSGHVFVVDDDDALRDSIVDLLRVVGYRVQCWASGRDFLAELPRVAPAVLVTDMRMPDMTASSYTRN